MRIIFCRKSINPEHIAQLKSVYRDVDDIDLYVGGFLEAAHEDSILGPVFKCIIGDQFARLKKGDRFFYDLGVDQNIAFSLVQLDEVDWWCFILLEEKNILLF